MQQRLHNLIAVGILAQDDQHRIIARNRTQNLGPLQAVDGFGSNAGAG